jgi:amidophosphoribosyltransferase
MMHPKVMCGIIGIVSKDNRDDIGALIAFGLYQLQHRGDFSAGIATIKKLPMSREAYKRFRLIAPEQTVKDSNPLSIEKNTGKVTDIFTKDKLKKLTGYTGIGHVRYATNSYAQTKDDDKLPPDKIEEMKKASIQPVHTIYSRVAMAHNGDVNNYHELTKHFEEKNIRRSGFNDAEVILKVFCEEFFTQEKDCDDKERVENSVRKVFENVKGTYCVVSVINNAGFLAYRDPNGRRPLFYGVKKDHNGNITDYAFASETTALRKMLFDGTREDKYADGRNAYEEIKPGEMIFISDEFEFHRKQVSEPKFMPCPFEGSYFARASSFINGRRVKLIRRNIIDYMWERFSQDTAYKRIMENKNDVVILPVPRTAESAAKYISNKTKIVLSDAIEKNAYAPRIFQQPTQEHRVKQTIADHFIFEEDVKGKIIILIDDSIVRGTTLREDIKYLKDVGAKEVHVLITFPPIRHPCMHAIDFHTEEELIAHGKSIEEIKKEIGLKPEESLIYALPEEISKANGYEKINMCRECYRDS